MLDSSCEEVAQTKNIERHAPFVQAITSSFQLSLKTRRLLEASLWSELHMFYHAIFLG